MDATHHWNLLKSAAAKFWHGEGLKTFLRESWHLYLCYMAAGAAAIPAGLLYGIWSLRHVQSTTTLIPFLVVGLVCAAFAYRWVNQKRRCPRCHELPHGGVKLDGYCWNCWPGYDICGNIRCGHYRCEHSLGVMTTVWAQDKSRIGEQTDFGMGCANAGCPCNEFLE